MNSLSAIVNYRLLPELRQLGIPCPDSSCDVLQPSTEYHRFTIATFHSEKRILCSQRRFIFSNASEPKLVIGEVTVIQPTPPETVTQFGLDITEKQFLLANPDLFEKALELITARWRAIQHYADHRLVDYIEEHCRTERALFSKEHVNRLLQLAGEAPNVDIDWVRLPQQAAEPFIKAAKHSLEKKTHHSGDPPPAKYQEGHIIIDGFTLVGP